MPILQLAALYLAPTAATPGYADRLREEIETYIRIAHKIARRKEIKRVAAFKLQSVARGYIVRAALLAANAARVSAVRNALAEAHVAHNGTWFRTGFLIPDEIQALICNWVPCEPEVAFNATAVLSGARVNPIIV